MPSFQDLTGRTFGRLLVLAHAGAHLKKHTQWLCLCDCGQHATVFATALKDARTQSCGCYRRATARAQGLKATHGHAGGGNPSKTYNSWQAMRQRCTNPKGREASTYAGITVCERWANSFENFLADMGERPDGMTLDRVRSSEGYSPGNCRWATPSQQRINQRRYIKDLL